MGLIRVLSFIITILIFEKIYYIVFFAISSIITIITLLIFHFVWIKDGLITFKISTVGLSEILYLIIIAVSSIHRVYDYLFETIVFDLGIFSPLAAIIFILFVIALLIGYANNNNN